ncbi:MAG: uroporphyrinogen-III C-methyltransferase [Cereibacter sphaeroides]|uniref:uroporphyrinogen-III C-methyltransferase n=1 Tax=Cereibacter sphaeroides TaxID=1063 RepID=A0A2W5TPZ5_CERSP|nr:MAG: uroporphyrinogen-III C-methyltransferase [Cereibacter sphaeroides]
MSILPDPGRITPAPASPDMGRISLVGAGPGARDLLTLRAIDRLREADIVFHDRLVDGEVLALIPHGTRVVNVGKEVGRNAWPQEVICALVVAEALAGARVVRLKSGDPSIFGRAREEIEAARAAGIAVEIVPGITAASAASAVLCEPLTERGRFNRLLVITGTDLHGRPVSDLAACAVPGTRIALYMAVQHLREISRILLAASVSPESDVQIVSHVATARERVSRTTLADLADAAGSIENPSVVLIGIAVQREASDEDALSVTGVSG